MLMTCSFMTIPYVVHLYDSAKFFTDDLSAAVPIIAGILLLLIYIFIAIATFKDAGIIPRNVIDNPLVYVSRKRRSIVHLGVMKKISKCETCLIIKPYRSSHCPDCDNCVIRFDHHCPWIGNCVGIKNYKFFFIFLVLMNVLTVYLISFSIYHCNRVRESLLEKEEQGIADLLSGNFLEAFNSYNTVIDELVQVDSDKVKLNVS